MAQQLINIGAAADDGTGEAIARPLFDKINDNFGELYQNGPTIDLDKYGVSPGNLPATNQAAIANVIADVKAANIPGFHLRLNRAGTFAITRGTGDYATRRAAILLPSNCHFELGANTKLQLQTAAGATDEPSYMVRNDDPINGNVNITLSGGYWDGNCGDDGDVEEVVVGGQGWYAQAMWWENVTNLVVRDFTGQDPGKWFMAGTKLYRSKFQNIHFDDVIRDGIHLCAEIYDCEISGITGTTGDNTLALSTRQNQTQGQSGGYFGGQYNWADGTLIAGDIERVLIKECTFNDCNGPIALLGNSTEHIHDVTIQKLRGSSAANSQYAIAVKLYPLVGTDVEVRRLVIEDVAVSTRSAGTSAALFIDAAGGVKDVKISKVSAIGGSAVMLNGSDYETIQIDDLSISGGDSIQQLVQLGPASTFHAKSIQAGRLSSVVASGSAYGIQCSGNATWDNFTIDSYHYENYDGTGQAFFGANGQRVDIGKCSLLGDNTGTSSRCFAGDVQLNIDDLTFDRQYYLGYDRTRIHAKRIRTVAATPVGRLGARASCHADRQWHHERISYTDCSAAATNKMVRQIALPRGAIVTAIAIRPSTAFAGTGITASSMDIRRTVPSGVIGSSQSTFTVSLTTDTNVQAIANAQAYMNAPLYLQIFAFSTGANLDQLTAGEAEVMIEYMVHAVAA